MMAAAQINRLRKKHVALWTQQQRLRHLQSISVCNVIACPDLPDKEMALKFTMHADMEAPAFYTSEICSDVLNPKWRNLDPSQYPETINTAIPAIVIRIWCSHRNKEHIIIEWIVHFTGLQYIGEQILKNDKKCRSNTVIFRMFEGYYTDPDCLQVINPPVNLEARRASVQFDIHAMRKSYNVSSLQRIHTVQRAVKQTQASIWRLRSEINQRLQATQKNNEKLAEKEKLRIMTNILTTEVKVQRHRSTVLRGQVNEAVLAVCTKRKDLAQNRNRLLEEKSKFEENKMSFNYKREILLKTNAELALRRRQLIRELECIYPIESIDNPRYFAPHGTENSKIPCLSNSYQISVDKGYSICNVHLPGSEDFAGHDETMIAVALGYTAHLILMIAEFLDVPLRYPIKHLGSRSRIINHIIEELGEKEREFPLYSKGKEKMQFNFAVFLLNKNLAQLRYYCGLITQDLRPTLTNLHELLHLQINDGLQRQISTTSQSLSDSRSIPSSSSILDHKTAILLSQQHRQRHPLQNSKSSTLPNFLNTGIPSPLTSPNTRLRFDNVIVDRTKPGVFQHSTHLLANDDSHLFQNGTSLSCSLDKGLDELQITGVRSSNVTSNPMRSGRSPKLQRAVALHSGSEPNLARHHAMQLVHFPIDSSPSSGEEARPFPLPSEEWATGSSHANSEDDFTVQDDFDHSTTQPLIVKRKIGIVCNGPMVPDREEKDEQCTNSNYENEVFGSF